MRTNGKERYQDGFEVFFENGEYGYFEEELKAHRKTQQKVIVTADTFSVVSADDVLTVDPDVIADTRKHTGLCLSDGFNIIPLRNCAEYALDSIFYLSTKFTDPLSPEEHARLLNEYAIKHMKKSKEILLFVQDKKVTGVMGASTYRELPAADVFAETRAFMEMYFPKAVFSEGYFSHELIYGQYDLSEHADDFNAVLAGVKYTPALTVLTSDCGLASVTFRPYISDSHIRIPINPLRIEHKGKMDKDPDTAREKMLDDIREKLNQCYSLIDKGVSDLERLKRITIRHPDTTLLRVMQACKIEKKAALTVADNHKEKWEGTSTALDLFRCICETQLYSDPGKTPEQRFREADDIARAAAVNWDKYDLPGDFSW